MENILLQNTFASTMASLSGTSHTNTSAASPVIKNISTEKTDYLSDFGDYCAAIVSNCYNGFKDALAAVGNFFYNIATDLYCANLSQKDIDQIHFNFAKSLRSVSSFSSEDIEEKIPAALLSRKQLVEILKRMHHLDGANINRVMTVINQDTKYLSIEEWAYVSTMLDAISIDWTERLAIDFDDYRKAQARYESRDPEHVANEKKMADDTFQLMSRNRFLLKNLDHLKHISRLQWAHLAHEAIIDELENHYQPIWNQGYAGLTTYSASVGGAVGISAGNLTAGASATGFYETELFLDDERCPGELQLYNIGVTAEVKASLTPALKAIASANGTLTGGVYVDWSGPRDYATNRFGTLINLAENQRNPKIARYLSRSSTLAASEIHSDIKSDYSLWAITRNEVAEIDKLKSDYDLMKKDMEKQLSLIVSSPDEALKKDDDIKIKNQKPVKFNPIHVAFVEAIPSDSLAYSMRVEGGVEMDFCTMFTAGASASYTRKHFSLPDVARTPLCERLFNPIKSKGQKATERVSIVKQIETQYNLFKHTLIANWKPIDYSAKNISAVDTPATIPATMKSSSSTEDNPEFLLAPLSQTLKPSTCPEKSLSTIRYSDPDSIETHFTYLKQDFKKLTTYYAGFAADKLKKGVPDQKDKNILLAFAKRYGANNTEQLLHRMIIANAYLFSKTTKQDTALRKNMLELEQLLLKPTFAVDDDYMRSHAYFEEDVLYEIIDNVYDVDISLSTEFPLSIGSTFRFEIQERERRFTNCLRDGYYLDFVFGFAEQIGDIQTVMNNIAPRIMSNLSEETAQGVLEALKTQLERIAPTFEGNVEKVFQIRLYKPRDYADTLPLRHIFTRQAVNKEMTFGVGGAIPVGVAEINFDLSYSNLSTDCEVEIYTGNSFFYFFMQNMREHHIDLIDADTGTISEKSYWHTIVEEQRAALIQLFTNYAMEQTGNNTALTKEIEAVSEAIEANIHLTKAEKQAFRHARDTFKKAVMPFSESKGGNDQFDQTLQCFQELMHAYYPHWNERYYNSALHEARPLTPIEEVDITG